MPDCVRVLLIAALMAFCSAGAAAADPADPVRKVMGIAERTWSDPPATEEYYFDTANLDTLYSKGFVEAFRIAEKNPAIPVEDGGEAGYLFDYDVITSSQDGCPLKDLQIKAGAEAGGRTEVDVSFRLWDCLPDAEERNKVSEIRFMVVMENGKPVIDDILRIEEGEGSSLVEEMREMGMPGEGEAE
jgi:hypothetical protein